MLPRAFSLVCALAPLQTTIAGQGAAQATFAPPPNDECLTATSIAGLGTFPFDLTHATASLPSHLCSGALLDVWFAWTAPGSSIRDYRFRELGFDHELDLFLVCGGALINCGANGVVDALNVAGGDTLLIRIADVPGSGTLEVLDVTPPPNDECTNPAPITGPGPFAFTTLGASDDDVWFAWTAPTTDFWQFLADHHTWDFDVYEVLDCPPMVPLSINDNLPLTRIFAVSGNDYLLRVGGVEGTGTFVASTFVPPTNDRCELGTPIGGVGAFPFDTTDATASGAADPTSTTCADEFDFDIWFRWTTPFVGGPFRFRVINTLIPTGVMVYADCDGQPLGLMHLDCGNTIIVPALAGATPYWIRLSTFTEGGPGDFVINRSIGNPLNDTCDGAEPIHGEGTYYFDLFSAEIEDIVDPACAPTPLVIHDVWYDWTAPRTSTFRVDTCSQTVFDSVLAVYEGNACPPVLNLGCSHDDCGVQSLVEFPATAGMQYLFRVGRDVGSLYEGGQLRVSDIGPSGGIGLPYCAAVPNSSGTPAQIRAFGSPSVSADNLALQADGLPPSVVGLFFFGTHQVEIPLGDGTACVGGQVFRMPIRPSDPAGMLTEPDFWALANSTFVMAGSTWNFQCWFRDSAAGMSGFNLSNGTTLSFVP